MRCNTLRASIETPLFMVTQHSDRAGATGKAIAEKKNTGGGIDIESVRVEFIVLMVKRALVRLFKILQTILFQFICAYCHLKCIRLIWYGGIEMEAQRVIFVSLLLFFAAIGNGGIEMEIKSHTGFMNRNCIGVTLCICCHLIISCRFSATIYLCARARECVSLFLVAEPLEVEDNRDIRFRLNDAYSVRINDFPSARSSKPFNYSVFF